MSAFGDYGVFNDVKVSNDEEIFFVVYYGVGICDFVMDLQSIY